MSFSAHGGIGVWWRMKDERRPVCRTMGVSFWRRRVKILSFMRSGKLLNRGKLAGVAVPCPDEILLPLLTTAVLGLARGEDRLWSCELRLTDTRWFVLGDGGDPIRIRFFPTCSLIGVVETARPLMCIGAFSSSSSRSSHKSLARRRFVRGVSLEVSSEVGVSVTAAGDDDGCRSVPEMRVLNLSSG